MKKLLVAVLLAAGAITSHAQETIGEVSTSIHLLGANDKLVIEAYDDPKVQGATCYVSHAKTGGISGSVGLAEDPSEFSIACRALSGAARISQSFQNGEDVFSESRSIYFKKMHVVRFYDQKRNVIIYMTYSDKLIDGSPKNSISVVQLGAK